MTLFKKNVVLLLITCLSILIGCVQKPKGEYLPYYQADTEKPYADVLAELEIAISEHNFRITGHSRVGKVIRERGTKDFPEYDTLQFCNLTHAKTLLLDVQVFPFHCHQTLTFTQQNNTFRGVAIFAKACFGHPSPSKQQKLNATTYASGGPDSSSSPRPDPTRGRNIGSK
ncbi:hypothetical protein BJAS_P1176 [Bathymodiolus japonicus methanotrophic gill symbiont]|nr:hypothetical protein BJAS_P1176 [Bathymodiolus japonicus methanotrophic gill symbiont]